MKAGMRGKIVVILVAVSLLTAVPNPALADKFREQDTIVFSVGGFVFVCAAAYFMWLNRPSQQDKVDLGVRGPGGFYFGGFTGGSLVESGDWKFPFTKTSKVDYDPGVVGGLKLGYFCHKFPYLGCEFEGNFTRNEVKSGSLSLSPPVGGQTSGVINSKEFHIMTWSFHLLGRYGFLPDKEVPFGRVQPYVGIGPGWVVIWSDTDSGKNLSLEALAGVRYMLLKNLSTFVEYKYSRQWQVELESQEIIHANGFQRGTSKFDFSSHKIVVGIAFHFL